MSGHRSVLSPPVMRSTIVLVALLSLTVFAASAQTSTEDANAVASATACSVSNTVRADVVALDQPIMLNRLGAALPQGMIFSLLEDVVPKSGSGSLVAGQVMLRPDKRPRPMVLRVNQGQCLQVNFWNLLTPCADASCSNITENNPLQPITRAAGVHAEGMQLYNQPPPFSPSTNSSPYITNDGSFVGKNPTSLVSPFGGSLNPANPGAPQITYVVYAEHDGTYLLYSTGATFGATNTAGQLTAGLFGSVIVEPPRAEYYRSQVTAAELKLACQRQNPSDPKSPCKMAPDNQHFLINYDAVYPPGTKYACKPILKMADFPLVQQANTCVPASGPKGLKLRHTDLTAIITGPNHGRFPETEQGPEFSPVPASPDRRAPFREFTIHYHEALTAVQAFKQFYPPPPTPDPSATPAATPNPNTWVNISGVITAGADNFGINYGFGAIGTEVLANRFHVGPMWNCKDCKFEEFFLASWAVGDPAMVVDLPADSPANTQPSKPNVISPLVEQMEAYQAATTAGCQESNNCPDPPDDPQSGKKANLAFYPDDPSNVYHSYLDDHVQFRILHAGAQFTHVHHQHAHQWQHSPNDPDGSYLDSQMLSPGGTYTLEIDYNGSGNRNKTVGDSIFHCHFYPHFAEGMWGLWRVHDVFEAGTELDPSTGIPLPGARALPDGEIANGTPIPAIVPLPTLAMAPLPARIKIVPAYAPPVSPNSEIAAVQVGYKVEVLDKGKNPGYPFFVPGIAGVRAPHPPLDFACELLPTNLCKKDAKGNFVYLDGGLPRHLVLDGTEDDEHHNQWDFTKNNHELVAQAIPEDGTDVEKSAINYFKVRNYPGYTPTGQQGTFVTNGLPRGPQPGAPFADPGVDDQGKAVGTVRRYKAADIQTDVTFNKKGWHYPQERFITLWDDAKPTINGQRAPEPFFFRANSRTDIVELWLANLVPNYYELDDFQVRTPTDILGQHIHLVKFDVLASDGASNGFNYEDGTFSPDEVRERIDAINQRGGLWSADGKSQTKLQAKVIPELGAGPTSGSTAWVGAQATIQRWYADPLDGCFWPPCKGTTPGKDRTLRTVFTHDHFGPSTHQQAGLYAGLLVEPEGSTWTSPDGKTVYGTRKSDGGPTSWAANIVNNLNPNDSFREFALEYQDLSLTYLKNSIPSPTPYNPVYPPITPTSTPWGWSDCPQAVNSSGGCGPSNNSPLITNPTLITSGQGIGAMALNYRNEPLPFRVNGAHTVSDPLTDLSYGLSSCQQGFALCGNRKDPDLNGQPPLKKPIAPGSPFWFPGGFPGAQPGDPYTPLLRAYQGDKVQIRVLVGGYFFLHNFSGHGFKWLFEPSNGSSGYRDNQGTGISEHFEMQFTAPTTANNPNVKTGPSFTDYAYMGGASAVDLADGNWGMLRAYNGAKGMKLLPDLAPLKNNPGGGVPLTGNASCPSGSPVRTYYVSAVSGQALVYNGRDPGNFITNTANPTPTPAPSPTSTPVIPARNLLAGLVYVQTDSYGNPLTPLPPKDPLVLRAAAGECVQVTLTNNFRPDNLVFTMPDPNSPPSVPDNDQATISLYTSVRVGLHPQLVSYDATQNSGLNVGFNPEQTVPVGGKRTYTWYAGNVTTNSDGSVTGTPIELGSVNLLDSDTMEQQPRALIGSLIVEPAGSVWCPVGSTQNCSTTSPVPGTMADVTDSKGNKFRELVGMLQDNVYLSTQSNATNQSFNASLNYGSEPMSYRDPNDNFDQTDISSFFSNSMTNPSSGKPQGDPQTPIFCALAGTPVRFRMLHPDGLGHFPDNTWVLNGHVWQEEPYKPDASGTPSAVMGFNPLSQWLGSRDGFGPGNRFDMLLDSAGGSFRVPGDYLYESFPVGQFTQGTWGVFRVSASQSDETACEQLAAKPRLAPAVKHVPGERVLPHPFQSIKK